MTLFREYQRYIESELAHCDSQYALCQEIEALIHSEMTNLQTRMDYLVNSKDRLQQAYQMNSAHITHSSRSI